jgi:subtilase family serine protease
MVSAICPYCHILLVEADDNSLANLGRAVNQAVRLNANVVSNSYGGVEFRGQMSLASFYNHPGHVIVASAGDDGYGTQIPAAFNTVTAVGGTTLRHANNARRWLETVWDGTGSGCSDFISKPSWQSDRGCVNRTVNDVSAVADPRTGVAVYDSYGMPGWLVFGGTSAAAPIIAGVYALGGNASEVTGSYLYSHRAYLYDVTRGRNGSCDVPYLCTAGVGYDSPTGLGTPMGTDAF